MPPPPPRYIQLYPTLNCNQRCFFCFNTDYSPYADLSFDNSLKLLEILSYNAVKEIDIMGGEPLLLPWMPDFIAEALDRDISVNVSSNGSIPSMMKKLAGFDPENFHIGLSLEGSTAEKHNRITGAGHFEPLLTSLRELVSYNLNPVVKTVLTKTSCSDIKNIVELIRTLGIRRFYILHMDLLSTNEKLVQEALSYADFTDFFRKVMRFYTDMKINCVHASCFKRSFLPSNARCAGGVRKIAVMPDGSVFPCNLLVRENSFKLGNIFRDDFRSIWENPVLDFFRSFRENQCAADTCKNHQLCTGGCPAHNLYHYASADRADIRCSL